jgi:hypothetical protein
MGGTRILWSAAAAALLAVAWVALYLAVLATEGEGDIRTAAALVLAGLLVVSAAALGIAAIREPFRLPVLVAAAAILTVLALLSAASLGLFLLPAAVLAWIAVSRSARTR